MYVRKQNTEKVRRIGKEYGRMERKNRSLWALAQEGEKVEREHTQSTIKDQLKKKKSKESSWHSEKV